MTDIPDAAPEDAPRSAFLAGDRLVAGIWLALGVVAARVGLQVFVDVRSEGLRDLLLAEHAVEHFVQAVAQSWPLVALWTILPSPHRGALGKFRTVVSVVAVGAFVGGCVPEGEPQYRPGLDSVVAWSGWGAVVAVAVVAPWFERWLYRPTRWFWRPSVATRFTITALALVTGGAVTVAINQTIEYDRRFIYVEGPVRDGGDLLECHRRGESRLLRGSAELASLLPGGSYQTDGGNRPSLVLQPGSALEFDVLLDPDCKLKFSVGVSLLSVRRLHAQKPSWDPTIEFRVEVDGDEVWSRSIDPVGDDDDRRWFEAEVDLEDFARVDEPTSLRLVVDADEEGARFLRAGFGRPRVLTGRSVPRSPSSREDFNVVLIAVDSLRADRLGAEVQGPGGTLHAMTPTLNALAEESIVYDRAISPSSWTWPATASLLTGTPPPGHGVVSEERCFLSDTMDTIPELLQIVGITTGGWTNSPLISEHKNFSQGFELWRERRFTGATFVVGEFRDFVRRHRAYQWFAYLHLSDLQAPYGAPTRHRAPFVGAPLDGHMNGGLAARALALAEGDTSARPTDDELAGLEALYDEELHYVDSQIARVRRTLETQGLWDRTVLIVVGTHGEEFLEHGGLEHGWTLHREVLDVPLIVRDPRRPAARIAQPVDLTQVAETILTQIAYPLRRGGRRSPPMVPFAVGTQEYVPFSHTQREVLSGETLASFAVQNERFKLLVTRSTNGNDEASSVSTRLYDLTADPGELHDVSSDHPEVAEDLERHLDKWLESCRHIAVELPEEVRLDPRFLPFTRGRDGPVRGGSNDSSGT